MIQGVGVAGMCRNNSVQSVNDGSTRLNNLYFAYGSIVLSTFCNGLKRHGEVYVVVVVVAVFV